MNKRMAYILLCTVGVIMVFIAVRMILNTLAFLDQSQRATATVIDFKIHESSDGDTYSPVFQFHTRDGQEVLCHYPINSSPRGWSIGDEATVAYDPGNPEEAKVLTFFATFGIAAVLLMIAAPMIALAACYFITARFLR